MKDIPGVCELYYEDGTWGDAETILCVGEVACQGRNVTDRHSPTHQCKYHVRLPWLRV